MPRKRDQAAVTIDHLRASAAGCEQCDLYKRATQTVFGEGPPHARLVMIGEQPGDHEDKDGHPFVGPPGISSTGRSMKPGSIAQAVLGRSFRVTKSRGQFFSLPSGIEAIATIHPSAVLRSDDRAAALAGLVHDLEIVRDRLATA